MSKRPAKAASQPTVTAAETPAARPEMFTSVSVASRDSLLAGLRDAQRRAVTFDGRAL